MQKALITLTREGRYFRVEVYVDGNIEPATVFGCRDRLLPVLAALETGQGTDGARWSSTEPYTLTAPTSIAVRLPSGRFIAYSLVIAQEPFPDGPQIV